QPRLDPQQGQQGQAEQQERGSDSQGRLESGHRQSSLGQSVRSASSRRTHAAATAATAAANATPAGSINSMNCPNITTGPRSPAGASPQRRPPGPRRGAGRQDGTPPGPGTPTPPGRGSPPGPRPQPPTRDSRHTPVRGDAVLAVLEVRVQVAELVGLVRAASDQRLRQRTPERLGRRHQTLQRPNGVGE